MNTNYSVSDFIRHYLTIKERFIPNKNKVYQYFKEYVGANISDNEVLLKDLLKYSKYYSDIINPDSNLPFFIGINKINKLESVVTYPFLMEVFDDYKENDNLTESDFKEILDIIVSFVFRRLICEVPTNALNKIFMVLGREIKKYEDYTDKYLDIFKRVITQKRYSQRFPDDEEFSAKLLVRDIYNFKSKNKLFLLEQLENFENKERVDVENLVYTKELTIEHIMPQTLTPIWRENLGDDCVNIHERYLNSLGNITLTAYNSKMSNKPFLEKRDMEKGFKESRLFLNKKLQVIENWNKEAIECRADYLMNRCLEIWKFPNSNYIPKEEELKMFTLADDETNFTGESVLNFRIMKGKDVRVDSWKDFYRKLSKILYDLDPIKFRSVSIEKNFIYKGEILKDPIKVDDFYLYANLNIESFLARLRILTEGIGLELDEITFGIE